MDHRRIAASLKHDAAWLDRYLTFVLSPEPPNGSVEMHHILPKAAFPAYASFEEFPENRATLSPAHHFIAHYYLFKAFPGNPSIMMAFRMMMGRFSKALKEHGYSEEFVLEVAAAYEIAKRAGRPWDEGARQRRSESMKGKPVPAKLTRLGVTVSEETKARMSETQREAYARDPLAPQFINKPCGPDHWTYGKERPESTRSKIAASLTGKEASDLTRTRMSIANASRMLDAITPEETAAFEQAIKVKTEEEMLLIRRLHPTNSRPYNILTGLIHIRLNRTGDVAPRYWQQAANWLHHAGYTWDKKGMIPCVTPATARLGTGHPLASNQLSAHELRKSGVSKGVTRARQAYDEIPLGEKLMLLNSWGLTTRSPGPCTVDPLVAARKNTVTRTRPYNILFGMQWILEGRATAETFERWRQAALFLRLSGCDVPLGPEAMAALNRVCPPELS